MPTGYTAAIKDGISFKKFVMDCARAFDACIDMKEDPVDKPIPEEFKPSNYYVEQIEKAEKELLKYATMSVLEAEQIAQKEYDEKRVSYKLSIKENEELLHKYQEMLKQVEKWVPPTAEHVEMKHFMIEQIDKSIDFDCMRDYYQRELKGLKRLSGEEWRKQRLEMVVQDIKYHAEHYEKEKSNAKNRTEWIKALRESLKDEK